MRDHKRDSSAAARRPANVSQWLVMRFDTVIDSHEPAASRCRARRDRVLFARIIECPTAHRRARRTILLRLSKTARPITTLRPVPALSQDIRPTRSHGPAVRQFFPRLPLGQRKRFHRSKGRFGHQTSPTSTANTTSIILFLPGARLIPPSAWRLRPPWRIQRGPTKARLFSPTQFGKQDLTPIPPASTRLTPAFSSTPMDQYGWPLVPTRQVFW